VDAHEGPVLPDVVVRYGRTGTCRAYAVAAGGDDAAEAAARLAGPDAAAWLGRSYGTVLERVVLCLGGPGGAGETAGVRVVDAEGFLLSLADPGCPALQNPEREVDLALFFGEGWDGAPLPAHGLPEGFAWSLVEGTMLINATTKVAFLFNKQYEKPNSVLIAISSL